MGRKSELPNKAEFTELWNTGSMSREAVANYYGVGKNHVTRWAHTFGLGRKVQHRAATYYKIDEENMDKCLGCKLPDCYDGCSVHDKHR